MGLRDGAGSGRIAGGKRRAPVQAYDFRRPNKFSREHVRTLQIVGETFARQFSTVLGTALRSISNVTLQRVEEVSYDEYVDALPNPSYLAVLSLEPLNSPGLFQMEMPVAMAIIERLLGGNDDSSPPQRPLTTIEEHLVRRVMERGLRELDYAFESLVAIEAKIVQQESNPQFAQIAAPSDMTVVLTLEMKIAEQIGTGTICIPFVALAPVIEAFASQSAFADRDLARRADFTKNLEHALHDVPLAVSARFNPIRLSSSQIVHLRPGDVVPLHHPVDEPMTMTVGDVSAFDVVTGKRGKRLACVVVEPGDAVA